MKKNLLRVLIVDPNGPSRTSFRRRLEIHPNISTVDEAGSTEAALLKIMEQSPDIVFLCLRNSGQKDIRLIELVKAKELPCYFVIVSTGTNFAIHAIRNCVYAFLLKPITAPALNKIIEQYLNRKKTDINEKLMRLISTIDENKRMRIPSTCEYTFVDPNHIVYCEANGAYTTIHLDNGTREIGNTYLGGIIRRLPQDRFYRISRFFLINLDKLLRIDKTVGTCVLESGEKRITLQGARKRLSLLCE